MSNPIKESLAISDFADIAVWRKRGVLNRSQLLGNFVVASSVSVCLFLRDGVKESTIARQQVIHTGITRANDVKYAVAY